jgi:sodium transport system permease protein
VITVVVTSLFMPLFVVGMVIVMGDILNPDMTETPVRLPVVGRENAPALINFLEQAGVELLPAPADPEDDIKNGVWDVILVIPPEYGEEFTTGSPAPVELVFDSSRMSASSSIQRIGSLLDGYSRQIGAIRLMARGVNPEITSAIQVKSVDVATPQSQSLLFLNMMPFFMIMVVFMGGMYVVIDATAGERERGSLEPLLINPVRRGELVMGKLLASLPYTTAMLIVALVTTGVAFNWIPLEEYTGFPISVDLSALLTIFWICLPMVVLAGGLQMILASFTHSFKEAQTYLSFLPLVAGLPSAFLIFLSVKTTPQAVMIPGFGQGLLINQVMRGETVDPANLAISVAATLVLSIIAVVISIKLYEREALLFGKK